MSKGSTSGGFMTPREIAEVCRSLGARVLLEGNRYKIFPPDKSARPVFFSADRPTRGTHLPNVLALLHAGGLDIRGAILAQQQPGPAQSQTPKPRLTQNLAGQLAGLELVTDSDDTDSADSSADTDTNQEPDVADPRPTPPPYPTLSAATRQALAELRDDILELLAGAEKRIVALEHEVEQLRERGEALRGPSKSELVRRQVWQWFLEHPGQKTTPQVLEMNISDQLPESYGTTMVAAGCRELVLAGRLQGGGARTDGPSKRGVYWYDPGMDSKPGADIA